MIKTNKSENEKDKNKFHDFNNKIFEKYGERRKMLDIDATFWNYIDNKVVLIEGAYCNEYIKDISLLDSYLNHKDKNIRKHNRNKYLFLLKMAKQLKADFYLIGFNENLDNVSVTKAELIKDNEIKEKRKICKKSEYETWIIDLNNKGQKQKYKERGKINIIEDTGNQLLLE